MVSVVVVPQNPAKASDTDQATKVLRNETVHAVNTVHEPAGRGDRGLKTTSNSRAADTHSLPLLLSFAASSPSIKGSHRGTRQLIVAAQPMELSE